MNKPAQLTLQPIRAWGWLSIAFVPSLILISLFLWWLTPPAPTQADLGDNILWSSPDSQNTRSIAWGDADGDGDLDIAVGNIGGVNQIYFNEGQGDFTVYDLGANIHDTRSIAWGDADGDGDLDIAVGNDDGVNHIYFNEGQRQFTVQDLGTDLRITLSVAWGDTDGDGDLDIAVGNNGSGNQIYINDGQGQFISRTISTDLKVTRSLAWGDADGDGDLDIAVGNGGDNGDVNQIYFNDGQGQFTMQSLGTAISDTYSIIWGDADGDGDLDIAVGNVGDVNQIYFNNGQGRFTLGNLDREIVSRDTYALAWGDADGDGDLDIAVGNRGEINQIYFNNGQGQFTEIRDLDSTDDKGTRSIAWGDADGDGDLDIAVGNRPEVNQVYLNDEQKHFTKRELPNDRRTSSVAWGDADGDGDLDIAIGNYSSYNQLYRNIGQGQFIIEDLYMDIKFTHSLAWGDADGDGDLDIAVGNENQVNQLYRNEGQGLFMIEDLGIDSKNTRSVAWGDADGDGDLDIAVGNRYQVNQLYFNNGQGQFVSSTLGLDKKETYSIAWGDADGDGDLDIAVGNNEGNQIYFNDGQGQFTVQDLGEDNTETYSIAWGDADGDGDLDIAVGNWNRVDQLYFNDGRGQFMVQHLGTDSKRTQSIAWGDADGDGDLDIAVGNKADVNQVYFNDGQGQFRAYDLNEDSKNTSSIAWGDVDSDGDLDIAVGNEADVNQVYQNYRQGGIGLPNNPPHLTITRPDNTDNANLYVSPELPLSNIIPIAYSLFDPEGDTIGQIDVFYSLDGGGYWHPTIATSNTLTTHLRTDFLTHYATNLSPTQIVRDYITSSLQVTADAQIVNTTVWLTLTHNNVASLTIILRSPMGTHVPLVTPGDASGQQLAYTHFSDQANIPLISGTFPYSSTYQPAGSLSDLAYQTSRGAWSLLITPSITSTSGTLAAWGLQFETPPKHVYHWDTLASGFFGHSDNVVLRFVASLPTANNAPSQTYHYTNTTPGAYQRPYVSAITFPFRARGTQVRVFRRSENRVGPVKGAMVYRLPNDQTRGATLMPEANHPTQTNVQGYLPGRGTLTNGDQLMALVPIVNPITFTDKISLYHTSAQPTPTGLDMQLVETSGIQVLEISNQNYLMLLNLDISLEWDSRHDPDYLEQLELDIQRTSEILFDLSNGQVALGHIRIFQTHEHWNEADIVIYATNNLRPNANIGGIVTVPYDDLYKDSQEKITNAYIPGQIRMGATWNRYGNAGGSIGEDWPRVLAHEIGHYAFFLLDNYLGLSNDNLLTEVDCQGSAMTDAYRQDYSEFLTKVNAAGDGFAWTGDCLKTVAEHTTGRPDWETIAHFYPFLKEPLTNTLSGPSRLPLAITHISFEAPVVPTNTLAAPFYYLTDERRKPAGSYPWSSGRDCLQNTRHI